MTTSKIVSATISAMPVSLFDPMPKVTATFDDGREVELFQYYPDELTFTTRAARKPRRFRAGRTGPVVIAKTLV